MKSFIRTTFIALLTAFLLIGSSGMAYAQKQSTKQPKSLVTQDMAYKIAQRIMYDRRSTFYRAMFNNANDIRTLQESDKILSDLGNHLDYAENFIISFFDYYGTGDTGYIAFKSFYLTPKEYQIAESIFNKIIEKDKQEARALEQSVYNEYVNNGFPSNIKNESNFKPAKFAMNANSLAKYINKLGFRESCINTTYDVAVDKDGVLSVSPNDDLFAATEFKMKSAPVVVFKNLEKSLYVPSKYKLKIVEKKEKALSDKVVNIKWNKEKLQWDIDNHNEFRNEVGQSVYYNATGDLLQTLNNLPELKDVKKKKHAISVTAYINGIVRCYLNDEEIGVELLRPYIFVKIVK